MLTSRLSISLCIAVLGLASGCGNAVDGYFSAQETAAQEYCDCEAPDTTAVTMCLARLDLPNDTQRQCIQDVYAANAAAMQENVECRTSAVDAAHTCVIEARCGALELGACWLRLAGDVAGCPALPADINTQITACGGW